jgi:hypothetical protein
MNNMLHAQTMPAKRRRITVPPAVRMTEIRPPSCAPCTDYVFFCAARGLLFLLPQTNKAMLCKCAYKFGPAAGYFPDSSGMADE